MQGLEYGFDHFDLCPLHLWHISHAEWRDCFRACFRPIFAWSLFFALPRSDVNCCYHVVKRLPQLRSDHRLESVISRESSFLFNNLFFVYIMLARGVPCFQLFRKCASSKISVAAPFFNQVNIPLGLGLLFYLAYALSLRGGRRVRVISVATFSTL